MSCTLVMRGGATKPPRLVLPNVTTTLGIGASPVGVAPRLTSPRRRPTPAAYVYEAASSRRGEVDHQVDGFPPDVHVLGVDEPRSAATGGEGDLVATGFERPHRGDGRRRTHFG